MFHELSQVGIIDLGRFPVLFLTGIAVFLGQLLLDAQDFLLCISNIRICFFPLCPERGELSFQFPQPDDERVHAGVHRLRIVGIRAHISARFIFFDGLFDRA